MIKLKNYIIDFPHTLVMEKYELSRYGPASLTGLLTATYRKINSLHLGSGGGIQMRVVRKTIWLYGSTGHIVVIDPNLNVKWNISLEIPVFITDMTGDEFGDVIIASHLERGGGIYGFHTNGSYIGKLLHGMFYGVTYYNKILYALKFRLWYSKAEMMVRENGKWSEWKWSPSYLYLFGKSCQLVVNNSGMYLTLGRWLFILNQTNGELLSHNMKLEYSILADADRDGNILLFENAIKKNLYIKNIKSSGKHVVKFTNKLTGPIQGVIVSKNAKYLWLACGNISVEQHLNINT